MAKQSREGELNRLRAEFEVAESVLRQEISQGIGGAGNEELRAGEEGFRAPGSFPEVESCKLGYQGAQAKVDRERVVFQGEKDGFLHELEQVLADKAKAGSRLTRKWQACRRRSRSSSL